MTVADRISVMDHGRIVQIAHAGRNLRGAELALRRRLHRLGEHVRGHRATRRRASASSSPRRTALVIEAASGGARQGADGVVRGAAGEGAHRPRRAGRHARQRRRRRGVGHRLSRRHDALQRAARLRKAGARDACMNAQRTVERPITWDDKVWLSWAPDAGVVLAN